MEWLQYFFVTRTKLAWSDYQEIMREGAEKSTETADNYSSEHFSTHSVHRNGTCNAPTENAEGSDTDSLETTTTVGDCSTSDCDSSYLSDCDFNPNHNHNHCHKHQTDKAEIQDRHFDLSMNSDAGTEIWV